MNQDTLMTNLEPAACLWRIYFRLIIYLVNELKWLMFIYGEYYTVRAIYYSESLSLYGTVLITQMDMWAGDESWTICSIDV